MGSDIYTESAIAVRFEDFLNRKEISLKKNRRKIVDELVEKQLIDAQKASEKESEMIETKNGFISHLLSEISFEDSSGWENEEEAYRHSDIIKVFCSNTGIDYNKKLVDFNFRKFQNSRESGRDVEINTIYIMFDSNGMFETKPTKEGKELAKTLGIEELSETTWTVHSY